MGPSMGWGWTGDTRSRWEGCGTPREVLIPPHMGDPDNPETRLHTHTAGALPGWSVLPKRWNWDDAKAIIVCRGHSMGTLGDLGVKVPCLNGEGNDLQNQSSWSN